MRERSTWNRTQIMKSAAISKKADPYTMNQDHPQPAADKYVTGDPSTFAEDVHTPNTWESEYSGDAVKRNDIGMPEMRSDTFNHSEKTASDLLLKKADLAIATARLMLAGKRTASESVVEDQAVALMSVPDRELIASYRRLAGDDDAQDDADDEEQQKQAQDQDDDQAQDQEQKKQAQDQDDDQAQDQGQQQKQARRRASWKKAQQDQMAEQIQQMIQSGDLQQAQEQLQQLQQLQQQGQQQLQQQGQGQQPQQQGQGQPQQRAQGQQPQQQGQGQQPQQQQQSDEQVLDQMLAQDDQIIDDGGIQMDQSQMDVGMDDLGPEDEVLRTLFAQDDDQSQDQDQAQQKQARTASTRTVGTRPTAGVSKIGGTGGSTGGTVIDNLSSLWQSAPDVRDAFGIK